MTKKSERQCWNCQSKNMEPYLTGVRCRDCGATWNDLPDVGPAVLERGLGSDDSSTYHRGGKKGRPAPAVLTRALKARDHRAVTPQASRP